MRHLFQKGYIPWNKGLTKKTDERIKKAGKKPERYIVWNKGTKGIVKAWNKGKHTGNYGNGFKKGQPSWNKGKKGEYKLPKISKLLKGKQGELARNWKGGITPLELQIRHSFQYRQWRSDVFQRDNFTCQECGQRGGKIEAHHLKEFAKIIKEYQIRTLEQALNCEELWNINNGRTLCQKFHQKYHKK